MKESAARAIEEGQETLQMPPRDNTHRSIAGSALVGVLEVMGCRVNLDFGRRS